MLDPDTLPFYDPSREKKVAVITSGSSEIGFYTGLHLYMHGFTIYMCGVNSHRIKQSIKDIMGESKGRLIKNNKKWKKSKNKNKTDIHVSYPLTDEKFGSIHYIHLDLRDLKCVERAALKLHKMETQIDVLINNAGIIAVPYEMTKDGFEIQLQTNYVSHFLFSMKLLPLLQACHGRVISLSSFGHRLQYKYWKLDQNFNYKPNMIFTWFRYAMSKTCLIQFTKMLAIKYPDVMCVSLHPGLIMNTNLFSYWTRLPIIGMLFWLYFELIGYFFGISNEQGSIGILKCALSLELTRETDNGKYFTTGGEESKSSSIANNLDDAASTWIWTVHALRDRGFEV